MSHDSGLSPARIAVAVVVQILPAASAEDTDPHP